MGGALSEMWGCAFDQAVELHESQRLPIARGCAVLQNRAAANPGRARRFYSAMYAGRIVNPVQAELQTEGSVAFGLGQALFEELVYDGGQLQNANLGDYMIASFEDMPHGLAVGLLEHPDAQRDPRHRRDVAAAGHAGDRQRRLPRDRRAHHRPADHAREGAARPARARAAGR